MEEEEEMEDGEQEEEEVGEEGIGTTEIEIGSER